MSLNWFRDIIGAKPSEDTPVNPVACALDVSAELALIGTYNGYYFSHIDRDDVVFRHPDRAEMVKHYSELPHCLQTVSKSFRELHSG